MHKNSNSKEDIVVSGISGRFPESDSIEELSNNLYSNIDMVTTDNRISLGYTGLPERYGQLKDKSKFDANYFDISQMEANLMDCQLRIMIEATFEAICDAGIDPNKLANTNTGVYIGGMYSEVPSAQAEDFSSVQGYYQNLTGSISQIFNFNGPSTMIESACSSSLTALNEAIHAMHNGLCDRAVVIGVSICNNPIHSYVLSRLHIISVDGRCKCLDSKANGYAKGDACAVILLERRNQSKRIYSTIVHSKINNDGWKYRSSIYPSADAQAHLIKHIYIESGIDPLDIHYVEAHCTATAAGDVVEMSAIEDAMCSGRKQPLLIGALKSNMGHTEGASGLCSLIKVILSFENQCIPSNLHMTEPNPNIPGLVSGILKPINENTPFFENMAAINSFGLGGSNVHLIVRADSKRPYIENTDISANIPRLVLMCGRTEEALNHTFTTILKNPKMLSRDYLCLLNGISKTSPFSTSSNALKGMKYRGFVILDKTDCNNSLNSNTIEMNKTLKTKPQIWYVLSGIGSQWHKIDDSLMAIEVFAQSIRASAEILNEYNIDLMSNLSENISNLMQCPINWFTYLTAIQIALVDVLNALDITLDGIVGHSIGELICAYVDHNISGVEAIQIAYWMGKYVKDVIQTTGVMNLCSYWDESPGILYNSEKLSTIREPLVERLKQLIPTNRLRSSKWISSIYEETDPKSKYISPEYFADILTLPVLLAQPFRQLPQNAVVIEISTQSSIQSIVKNSIGFDITYIPLMDTNGYNVKHLLQSIGKLYTTGANPAIERLYPNVEYPVSRGTPSISSLVKWNHNKSYTVYEYPDYFKPIDSTDFEVIIDVEGKDSYLFGHCIDGRPLFPATGCLQIVWKLFAKRHGLYYEDLAVEFQNVCLLRATVLPKNGFITFVVKILETNGQFVIKESNKVIVTGSVFVAQKPYNRFEYLLTEELMKNRDFFDENNELILKTKDIYKEIRLRGYEYRNDFQCLTKAVISSDRLKASIKWCGNWVSFADNLFQTSIMSRNSRRCYLPVRIDCIRFDPKALLAEAKQIGNSAPELLAIYDYNSGIGFTKGLEFKGILTVLPLKRVSAQVAIVENYRFVPYDEVSVQTDNDHYISRQYIEQCNGQAVRVAQKFNICFEDFHTNNEQILRAQEEYLHSTNDWSDSNTEDNNILLKLLTDLNRMNGNKIDDKLRQQLIENIMNSGKDLLNQYFIEEYFIRSLIETVFENMNTNKDNIIDVLEVSQSTGIIAPAVIRLIDMTSITTKINYNILQPTVHQLPNQSIDGIVCHKWIDGMSTLPPHLNGLDLILFEDKFNYHLTTDFTLNINQFLESVCNSLKENGFLIIFLKNNLIFAEELVIKMCGFCDNISVYELLSKRNNQIIREAKNVGFSLISTKVDNICRKSLIFRKISSVIRTENQTFIDITEDNYELWIKKLQNCMKTIDKRPETENIWLLAKDRPTNGIIGFVNCLRREPNGHRIRCIFDYNFKPEDNCNENDFLINNSEFLDIIVKKSLVFNVLNNNKVLGSFRKELIDLDSTTVAAEHCYLNELIPRDLSSFRWFECDHKYWPLGRKTGQNLYHIYYAPLNIRDSMLVTGKLVADALPEEIALQDCILGIEFSGRDENGVRVMGMTSSKCLAATVVLNDSDFVWPIPQHWSMEMASTVPVVYGTAYYALIVRGNLRPREIVLIHCGSDGIGLAAIHICLNLKCQLYITCSTDIKRQFLINEFPALNDKNIFTSCNSSYISYIMNETNDRGVDLVFNSMSGKTLQSSIQCLASNGRCLHIGKYESSLNRDFDLSQIIQNKSFHAIVLETLFDHKSNTSPVLRRHKAMLRQLIENGIKDGTVRPLKTTVFECSQVEQAFSFMASDRHIGKVVLKVRDEETDPRSHAINCVVKYQSIARTVFKPNKCYIIIGGLGGFGLELVNWMIERGAIHLVLTSRTGLKDSYQKYRVNYFKSLGINVQISTKDVSKETECRELIALANGFGEGVGGLFNVALVLADKMFKNQTADRFHKVLAPKALAVHNLDQISREMCPQLDYFVCFSSQASCLGNVGQTNYGFANSVMERVCECRRAQGLHGLAIQWGPIDDVGVLAETMGTEVTIIGLLSQRMSSCLATLDRILQTNCAVVGSVVMAVNKN